MRILIVEDDYLQAEVLSGALEQVLAREVPALSIDRIATEERFRAAMPALARDQPDVILMDVIVRWADANGPIPEPPEEVRREGPRRAGIRCQKLVAANPATRDIPVILYTVLEISDLRLELESLEGNFVCLSKNNQVGPLVEEIRRLRRVSRRPPPRPG